MIYQISCKDTNITDIYIGSTKNLEKRIEKHKSDCNKYNKNIKVYKFISNNGKFNNWIFTVIEELQNITKQEAKVRERYYIETLKSSLNSNIPTRTSKEYYEQNKEKKKEYNEQNKEQIQEYKKVYYEQNKDKIKEINKQYREQNKDKIKEQIQEYKKVYYEQNKDKIKEINKQYREQNKDKINEKIICECGCEIIKRNLQKHKKSKKHLVNV